MGTNYYWRLVSPTGKEVGQGNNDPKIHIGKTSARPAGKVAFIAAQDMGNVRRACQRDAYLMHQCIVNEYGRLYTGDEFLSMLRVCTIETDSIGTYFS